jgi:uncharacterized protein YpmS
MKRKTFEPGLWALVLLLLVSISCNLINRSDAVATQAIPVSTEALESLKQDIQAAGQQIESSGQATLVIDEQQLTSLIAFELQTQESPIFQEPQAYLRDGRIKILGKVQQGDPTSKLELVMDVSANADGRPEYQLTSAKIGLLPLPDIMLQQISGQLDTLFASKIDPRMDDIFIEKIIIADGVMTIQGHSR